MHILHFSVFFLTRTGLASQSEWYTSLMNPTTRSLKALVWFWLIDETLSANLVYQSNYEIGSTTPSDEAMAKIITMVMAW